MDELKKTPLHDVHLALGARMVPFAGFEMPVSYASIVSEHNAVRERVGVFDVSHMGEFFVTGPRAIEFVDRAVTNDCAKLTDGRVLYTVMCRDDGTAVDDLLVARMSAERVLIVANAANIDKDLAHLRSRLSSFDGAHLTDESDRWALLAVQGPRSARVLDACPSFSAIRDRLAALDYYHLLEVELAGRPAVLSRTGYTGELGFEVMVSAQDARRLWSELFEHGAADGIAPVGLAARDTLRFEASFCLYGHELDDETTPLEAGLGWVVKFQKLDFCGKANLEKERTQGAGRRLIGLELDGRNIARQGFDVERGGVVAGKITSGTFSPTLKKSLCMAMVSVPEEGAPQDLTVRVRDKAIAAREVALPFYPSRAR